MRLTEFRRYMATLGDEPTPEMLSAAGGVLWASLEEASRAGPRLTAREAGQQMGKDPWEPLEALTWHHAEAVARYLLGAPLVRGRTSLLDVCARVALDGRFGRGRQNFVGILGLFGGRGYGDELASLLPDWQLFGHVVGALRRAEIGGHAAAAIAQCPPEPALWVKIVLIDYAKFCAESRPLN